MDRLKRVTSWIWYPWLIALYPVVYQYATNFGKFDGSEFLIICGVIIVVVGLLVGLFWLPVRDIHRAAAMVAAAAVFFFTYTAFQDLVGSNNPKAVDWLIPFVVKMVLVMIIAIVVVGVWVSPSLLRRAAPSLNLIAVGLVLFNLGRLVVGTVQIAQAQEVHQAALSVSPSTPRLDNDASHPDIYYIILDAYPSNSFLMEKNGIDNSRFTGELEQLGFTVAHDSQSNYPATLTSLASSLNMRYLEPGESPPGMPGVSYARSLLADSLVASELQARGYTYIFMLSGFDTASTIADLSFDHYPDGMRTFSHDNPPPADSYTADFWPMLSDTTMLAETGFDAASLSRQLDRPTDWSDAHRALATFDETSRIALMPEATFTVVHLCLPHRPVRFTRRGEIIADPVSFRLANNKSNLQQSFVDQLEWLNERTLRMIDDIMSKSNPPPIIIIQGDHGGNLGNLYNRFGRLTFYKILNAYYLPGPQAQSVQLAQNIMPVNSFRVVFNTYFGTDYELLANQQFSMPQAYYDTFDLVEVPMR